MKLYELLSAAGIEIPEGVENREISNVVTNSQRVTKGSMFVCIRGLHTDGHKFINNAVEAGASVIVCEALRDECVGGAAAVKVSDTRRAVANLYNAWHGSPAEKLKIVGVTGTNGKTSVSHTLKKIFEGCGHKCGIIGTVGCMSGDRQLGSLSHDSLANMTTPDPEELFWLLSEMVKDGVEYVFLEASSHASALSKLDPIIFDTLVYTNLTQDHLDFHGNMENYFSAKAVLFARARKTVINIDDKYAERILAYSGAERNILCSTDKKTADYFVSDICIDAESGTSYKAFCREAVFDVKLPSFFGSFAVMNSLEAIAVAREYGLRDAEILETLASMSGVPGRMERVAFEKETGFSVFVDYAHTPDALENVLRTIRSFRGVSRVIVLFGCGGERDRTKRKLMGAIASRLSDIVIITSDNPRSEDRMAIIADIYRGIDKEKEHKIIPERESAIRFAVSIAREGDVILLAGKGHEKYEINKTGRVPFDEIQIVKNAVSERFC